MRIHLMNHLMAWLAFLVLAVPALGEHAASVEFDALIEYLAGIEVTPEVAAGLALDEKLIGGSLLTAVAAGDLCQKRSPVVAFESQKACEAAQTATRGVAKTGCYPKDAVAWSFDIFLTVPCGEETRSEPPGHDLADLLSLSKELPGIDIDEGLYWLDDTDSGDDPYNAGCHWFYSDPVCTQDRVFWRGDRCNDDGELVEWTDQECHTNTDTKTYDCDQLCRDDGHAGGSCKVKANICDTNSSAQCECFDIKPRTGVGQSK